MEKLYWVIEYVKVFLAFIFVMYLWPSVVFKKHLKTKNSRTYKFAFCTVVQFVLINTVVLGLGLIGLLKPFVFVILFYGVFLYFLLKDRKIKRVNKLRFKNMFSGTYGKRTIFLDTYRFIKKKTIKLKNIFCGYMKGHWSEYAVLFVIVAFGCIYFSVNPMQTNSYGFGDSYPHHSWTYQLTQGHIFSAGIYPEGMHCLIASLNMACGIPIYNSLLFLGPITSIFILLSAYIMFRELFRWKWSPALALTLFLVMDIKNETMLTGMARIQVGLPMEYGFPAMFLCVAYFIRFFMNGKKYNRSKIPVFLRDDDLRIFTFAVATTICAHFYATMLAVFLCLCVAVILIFRAFSPKTISFIIGCFAGLIIAGLPMLLAYAEGYPLQGSLTWAIGLITGNDKKASSTETAGTVSTSQVETEKETASKKVVTAQAKIPFRTRMQNTYKDSYVRLYGQERADFFIQFAFINFGIWMAVRIFVFKRRRSDDEYRFQGHQFDGYLALAITAPVITLAYSMHLLGVPQLIENYRVCSISHMFNFALVVVPADVIGVFIIDRFKKAIGTIIAVSSVIGIYVFARVNGCFHGFLSMEATRFNSAVNVTNAILEKMGKGSNNFTIVSTTDELYLVLGYGYHEELIDFINKSEGDKYSIPTEYIFIYIEKNVIKRAQKHYATGPSWLADNKYAGSDYQSVGTGMIKQTISKDYAELYFGKFPSKMVVYNTLWSRTVLFSKAFEWCQKFNAMYPNELHTFYEDDDLLVYYLRQNPRNLYELATIDTSVMLSPESYSKPIWPEDYRNAMQNMGKK